MMTTKTILSYLPVVLCMISCSEYLDLKPDRKLVVPATLADAQALLNNTGFLNRSEEAMPEMSADNYYLTNDVFNSLDEESQLIYTWDKEASPGGAGWSGYYRIVLYANQVLETIKDIEGPQSQLAILKGKALFFRANAYYQLAQLFCMPFDKSEASRYLGLPLRLSPGSSERSERATLQQTYDQIVLDFAEAAELLPDAVYEVTTQPNRAAAYAGLARTYLLMGEFEKALAMAESSLGVYDILIDFNELDVGAANPIVLFNKEVVYLSNYGGATLLRNNFCNVDTNLFDSYDHRDLRKKALFAMRDDGTIRFKGNYNGDDSQGIFNGLTTAEVLLIKAECLVRTGNLERGESALNDLLINRYETGQYQPASFSTVEDGLLKIVQERRKELLFRGARWVDLRRLNIDDRYQQAIYRNIAGKIYTLPANDRRYVFRIPDEVIVPSGMQQNDR